MVLYTISLILVSTFSGEDHFAAMRLVQFDEAFARRYRQLQTRDKNPLCKMQALGVLMNKLLRILWTLMRKHTLYVPDFQPTI